MAAARLIRITRTRTAKYRRSGTAGRLVFESAAVALYLTDRFPAHRIGPLVGDPRRGAYLTWLAYYAGEMEPAWVSAYQRNGDVPRGTAGWVKTDEVVEFVNATLFKGPYICWGKPSRRRTYWSAPLSRCSWGSPLLEKTSLLEAYVDRVVSRPAYARAQAKENG